MAQTGYTPISIYNSATTTNVPTAGNLVAGELAINTADGKLFYKDSSGVVQTLATKTAATFPNVNGSTSGAVTLAAPAVAGSNTATFPAATGTVMVSGNMPAFRAYLASTQNVSSGTWTKATINTKTFDTSSAFENVTNYRFTPQVSGYYQVNGTVTIVASTVFGTGGQVAIYKNGSQYSSSGLNNNSASTQSGGLTVSDLVYFNGSTDYIELYAYIYGGTGVQFAGGSANTFFSAILIRAA